jgi:cytoskeleton protein RodZ
MSNSESDKEIKEENIDFGSLLSEARKNRNYTVDDICEHIKIPVHFVLAMESNDLNALPSATFARGYLRAYAKFLEISDERIMEIYDRAAPRDQVKTLKPRSNLRNEASSQSPLIKTITILLIVAGIAAVIYGSYQYYQEKADVMESERDARQPGFNGSSLDSPGTSSLDLRQNSDSTDDAITSEASSQESSGSTPSEIDAQETAASVTGDEASASMQQDMADEAEDKAIVVSDVLEIFAENGSWVEVRDASNSRLFNNMVSKGDTKVIQGTAPFHVTLGNAKTTRMLINDLEIDMVKYIRSNNTVKITVSTEDQKVVIH